LLDEAGAGFRCFQIVHQCVLIYSEFDPVTECFLLSLKLDEIARHNVLQVLHVLFLVARKLLDEPLEGFTRLGLRRLLPSAEELGNTVLEDLIYEVLVAESLLLFRVLPNHAHYFT